ncbi:MAG: Imm5 family immunity protein [Bellilinea sp.]
MIRKDNAQLPEKLISLINHLLMNIQRDPCHRLQAKTQQVIYDSFGPRTDRQATSARGWLAVITARYVLSIFEQALSDEDHPRKLIEMAEATLRGNLRVEDAIHEAAEGHEIAGRLWGREDTEVTWNAYLAGTAAHRALAGPAWVVDGNYAKVRDIIWPRADTLIWLELPLAVVLWRLFWRTVRRVVTREELWNGNKETFRGAFFSKDSLLVYVFKSRKKHRQTYPDLFRQPEYSHLRLIHFRTAAQVESWLDTLIAR